MFSTADALNLSSAPSATPFALPTPFLLSAYFNTSSTNHVGGLPFPGFVAYSTTSAIMFIGGVPYTVDSFADNPTGGIAVAIFDRTNVFFPGIYGVGFIQDPVADGAGVVGNFSTTLHDFSVDNLVATHFRSYNGAGFSAGPNFGSTIQPIVLRRGGQAYNLTLGNREEQFAQGAPRHGAGLIPIPEPATVLLGGTALLALLVLRRRVII
jgi:hypothetical protein